VQELPDTLHQQVTALSERAEAAFAAGQFKQAIDFYWTALALLPPPETQWEAATWLLTGIGDACYLSNDLPRAIDALYNALNCPDAHENPFINLRLGQALYNSGRRDDAMNYLVRAFALEGDEIFEDGGEEHLAAVKLVIKT
jgi:tetratricopeptide (TPR) repeat protein